MGFRKNKVAVEGETCVLRIRKFPVALRDWLLLRAQEQDLSLRDYLVSKLQAAYEKSNDKPETTRPTQATTKKRLKTKSIANTDTKPVLKAKTRECLECGEQTSNESGYCDNCDAFGDLTPSVK